MLFKFGFMYGALYSCVKYSNIECKMTNMDLAINIMTLDLVRLGFFHLPSI